MYWVTPPGFILRASLQIHHCCTEPGFKTSQAPPSRQVDADIIDSISFSLNFDVHFPSYLSTQETLSTVEPIDTQNKDMLLRMSKRVQPKSIIRHHHRLLRHCLHLVHYRKGRSSTTKIKSLVVIASIISKSVHECSRRLIKFFSKLARRRHHQSISFLEQEETLFEAGVDPGLKLEFESSFAMPLVLVLNEHLQLLPPLASDKKRTIVLDLDETLVHSSPDPPPPLYDFTIKPNIDGERMNFYVLKRPGVDEFLEAISKKYEVVVFTAGLEPYASTLLDILDPKGLISHRLYRDSCKQVRGRFVKDLAKMGRDLGKVVMVDDNPKSYYLQPANAIPIKRFEDDVEDRELEKLLGFFERYCDGFDDMRDAVKQYLGGATMRTGQC
ncbi:Haloacid dehalogenase hydrolase domain-containing protein [Theobroma cacao]|uniref:Haloacid dehalogenase hydrolase domain-containing protein n=1 Tax=Theobroma cacao TaxID=3641 RepID=A0A061GDE2_THECC|nr:Haloacid dehalogenase hydrolase domain-containing protein [Theobroma cacao]